MYICIKQDSFTTNYVLCKAVMSELSYLLGHLSLATWCLSTPQTRWLEKQCLRTCQGILPRNMVSTYISKLTELYLSRTSHYVCSAHIFCHSQVKMWYHYFLMNWEGMQCSCISWGILTLVTVYRLGLVFMHRYWSLYLHKHSCDIMTSNTTFIPKISPQSLLWIPQEMPRKSLR
jgi:hypothetical protein